VRMPAVARSPAVSEDTVEASATAMEDEDEDKRLRSLPGADEDDDMGWHGTDVPPCLEARHGTLQP